MEIISQNSTATNTTAIEFKFSAEEFEEALNAAFNRQKSKISVPGFRKGKATRKIVEAHYGANVFFEDAVNYLYSSKIEAVVEKTGLDVVGVENVDVVSVDKAEGVSMKADIITKPVVEVSDYKGINVKKTVKAVTDEAVDAEIKKMCERVARMVTVEDRAVLEGDTAVIDFEGFVDGVAFEGGKGEKFPLEIGSHTFIPGFEEQIVGKNVGDEFDVNVTFPEDYQAENLKGKPAVFKCKVNEIKTKEMPELDDELVKDISEKDTVEELKTEIREKLEKQYKTDADEACDAELMDKMLDNMKAEIPNVMIERRIDDMAREWSMRTRIDIKDYLKYTGLTAEQFRSNFAAPAKRQVELRLCLEKIAELENIQVSQEDIDKEVAELAEQYKMDAEQVKKAIPEETLTEDLKIEKALDLVKDSAQIEEVTE